jgi:hypothetical protein
MDKQEPIPAEPSRKAGTEPETPIAPRGSAPDASLARQGQPRQATTAPRRVEIVLRVTPAEPQEGKREWTSCA